MAEGTLQITIYNQALVTDKRQYVYRGYTVSDLRGRATVPNPGDITTGSNYISCRDITTNKIETALGIDNNSVEDLCHHANVNKWSAFSPYYRTVVAGLLAHTPEGADREGSFAGYHHTAAVPHYDSITHDDDVYIIPGEVVHFAPTINIGELKYIGGDIIGHSDCLGLAFTVWDGSTLVAQDIINLAVETDIIFPDATLIGGSSSKTYTCKTYLVNSLASFDYTLADVTCKIAEITDYTKTVGMKAGTGALLSAPPGWAVSGTPISVTLSNGSITFQGLHHATYNGPLTVTAYYSDWLGNKVTDDTVLWSGTYSGNYGIIVSSVVIWKVAGVTQALPVPSFGYTATVFVNPA